jgi:hypothetical protein
VFPYRPYLKYVLNVTLTLATTAKYVTVAKTVSRRYEIT